MCNCSSVGYLNFNINRPTSSFCSNYFNFSSSRLFCCSKGRLTKLKFSRQVIIYNSDNRCLLEKSKLRQIRCIVHSCLFPCKPRIFKNDRKLSVRMIFFIIYNWNADLIINILIFTKR